MNGENKSEDQNLTSTTEQASVTDSIYNQKVEQPPADSDAEEKPAETEEKPVDAEVKEKSVETEEKPADSDAEEKPAEPIKLDISKDLGVNEEDLKDFEGLLNDLKDPSVDPSKRASEFIKAYQERSLESFKNAVENTVNDWAEASRKDPEFGGDSFDKNVALAKKALKAVTGDDFFKMLDETGMGSHPEMIRLGVRIGKKMSDGEVFTHSGDTTESKDLLSTIYKTQIKK
jgi:hypothetical protein